MATPGRFTWGDFSKADIRTLTLAGGKEVEHIKAGDMVFPRQMALRGNVPDQRLNRYRVQEMACRADDVLVCAYPKSGTHWVWEITQMLINGKAEYSGHPKEKAMLEFHLPETFDEMPSPRVLNSHYLYHDMPKDMNHKHSKVIFVLRNPKDTAVSMFHQFQNLFEGFMDDWNDFFDIFVNSAATYTNWFQYMLVWEEALRRNKQANTLIVYYEDIKEDPIPKIKEMAKFLEVQYNDSLISDIAKKCNFQTMKEAKIQHRIEQYKETPMQDKMVAITHRLYRKGQVGDWKNYFTVAQNEQFDAMFGEKMKDSSFKFRFTLD